MSDFDWKALVGSVAPTIATALGGPFAGMATKELASRLLGKDNATEEELQTALASATPETLAEVKRIDAEFKTKMKELGVDLERVHAGDRASARDLAKSTTLLPQAVLAGVFVLGFVVVMYAVFTGSVTLEGSTQQAAFILLGILSAGMTQILNFFFGSSAGSKEKTAHMAANKEGAPR